MSLNLRKALFLLGLLVFPIARASADPTAEQNKLLPEKIGAFRSRALVDAPTLGPSELFAPDNFAVVSQASRIYTSTEGDNFSVVALNARTYSGAYSILTTYAWGNLDIKRGLAGTAAILEIGRISFFKGTTFVQISWAGTTKENQESLLSFARTLAEGIDGGDNDIPVLVKHLPAWESAQQRASFAVSSNLLKQVLPDQPIINEVSFEAGSEAAFAHYGTAKMVIVEFSTPQIATENDQRINARLQELRGQGQRVPTSYRRVGNYSVFVFDAATVEAANQLIDQVKYQPMVQWLGESPYRYERALREFTQTTLGVFVNVVKGSGLALVSCLAVGGLIGGLMFVRRRAQQRDAESYSDAGAMLRLNLDELTPETDAARLLGRGK